MSAACVYAFYQITTRMLSRTDGPMTTLVYTAVVGTLAASVAAPFYWVAPDMSGWSLMVLLGFFGGTGHFAVIKAFQSSNAATITPFGYINLIWATLSGSFFSGNIPNQEYSSEQASSSAAAFISSIASAFRPANR